MKLIFPLAAAYLLFMSGGCDYFSEDSHTINQNIETVNLYVEEIWNDRNLPLLDSIIDDDFIDPASVTGEKGPEALKKIITHYLDVFPDIQFTIEEIIADRFKVAWSWSATATHQGEIWGIAPTFMQVTLHGMMIDRIENGKITQRQGIWDRMALKEQLLDHKRQSD